MRTSFSEFVLLRTVYAGRSPVYFASVSVKRTSGFWPFRKERISREWVWLLPPHGWRFLDTSKRCPGRQVGLLAVECAARELLNSTYSP